MDIQELLDNNELLIHMDDEDISKDVTASGEDKCFLLVKKACQLHQASHQEKKEDMQKRMRAIYFHSVCSCILEYVKLCRDSIVIEGKLTYSALEGHQDIGILLHDMIGNTSTRCEILQMDRYPEAATYIFRGKVPTGHEDMRVSILIEEAGEESRKPWNGLVQFGKVFPLEKSLSSSYALLGDWMVRYIRNELVFSHPSREDIMRQEEQFLRELHALGNSGADTAIRHRCAYHMVKPFLSQEIWLLSDRINKADDNGEALFQFLKSRDVAEKVVFVLRKDSSDYPRVSSYGKTVDYLSEEHLLCHLFADKIVSAHITGYVRNPFFHNIKYYRDILFGKQQIFLQHGIIKDDLSDSINRYQNYNLSMFVTSAVPEYESIVHGDYGYDDNVVKMTGLPRHDYLEDTGGKKILIMPTWRDDLCTWSEYNRTGEKGIASQFKESSFYRFYNSLLNDETLLECAKENGYTIFFMPHPNMMPHINLFEKNEKVVFCDFSTRYREMLSDGALLLTDYSSVAFDFAYLRKPVIYCHFESDGEFFSHHTYVKGYFSYEQDGFGEVEYSLQGTVRRLVEYMEMGCALKDKYRERIDKFFPYHDRENCARVYRAIKSLEHGTSSELLSHASLSDSIEWMNMYMSVTQSDGGRDRDECREGNISTQYMFPCHLVQSDDRVVLYGIGSVGQAFYWQNKRYHFCRVISCVDQNASNMKDGQIPVQSLQALKEMDYDYVIIAILKEGDAKAVREFLVRSGVPEEKIRWDGTRYKWKDFYKSLFGDMWDR